METVRHELEFHAIKFQPDFYVYILEENAERLGFCSLIPLDRETVELHDLFLDSGCTGKGYGKQLWIYAVNLACDLGSLFSLLTLTPSLFIPAVVLSPSAKKPPPRSLAGSSLSWSIHSLIASPEHLS